MLTSTFRQLNEKQNAYWFKTGRDTFRSYIRFIDQALPVSGTILDVGAGSVTLATYLPRLGKNGLLIAADYSNEGLVQNQSKAKVVTNAEAFPFASETFDVISASCVLEHIENPIPVVTECFRVLKKGGTLVFYTPHRRSYIAALARLTPLSFHRWIRMLQTGKSIREVEVIKTFYRLNTFQDLAKHRGDFSLGSLEICIGAPSYTTFLPPPFHFLFILFHKFLQSVPFLRQAFGETIIGCLKKP